MEKKHYNSDTVFKETLKSEVRDNPNFSVFEVAGKVKEEEDYFDNLRKASLMRIEVD